jgi:hypothetical protein
LASIEGMHASAPGKMVASAHSDGAANVQPTIGPAALLSAGQQGYFQRAAAASRCPFACAGAIDSPTGLEGHAALEFAARHLRQCRQFRPNLAAGRPMNERPLDVERTSMERSPQSDNAQRAAWLQDCAAIAVMVALTSALFVTKLGFYSDDWRNLSIFFFSDDQSLAGLSKSILSADARVSESAATGALARPLQVLYLAVLYQAFGLDPLGYHVVNTLVFLFGLCVFYSALRVLGAERLLALAVVLVYGTLPHYSSDRFWYAAFQANLSMGLFFVSLHASLRLVTAVGSMRVVWMATAALGLVGSALAYEAFLPLSVLGLFVVALKHLQLAGDPSAPRLRVGDLAALYIGMPALIVLIVYYKMAVTTRVGSVGSWMLNDALSSAVELTFVAYGTNLPRVLQTIWREHFDWSVLYVAVIVAAGVWWSLWRTAIGVRSHGPSTRLLVAIALGSVVATGLSYAYFYDFFRVSTGINNRVANAASVCVALFVVSALNLACRALWRPHSTLALCCMVAAVCGCGTLITNTIATFWIEASRQQAEVMRELRRVWPQPPAGSSILLTGVCSWVGPGIVFETDWDVSGAARLLYRDQALRGDVLRPWMTAEEGGLRNGDAFYSYASLHVYDGRTKEVRQVRDQSGASALLGSLAKEGAAGCAGNYKAFGAGLPVW